ncbi:amidase family protein, partial [Streptococcus iniae]
NGLAFLDGKTSQSTSGFVKKLQEAGFVVIGQSSFPEMGWINVTNSDLYGITHNPWQLDKNPGGSSGGSAAAVASGQVSLASASDGGGSTRDPCFLERINWASP